MKRTVDPLDELLGRVRAGVLADLLAPGRGPLYVREIARRTGLAVAAVQRELATLGRLGIVRAERRGRQVFHTADPTSPLHAALSMLIGTRGDATTAAAAALLALGRRVRLAVRYGPAGVDDPLMLVVVGEAAFEDVLGAVAPAAAGAGVEPRLLVFTETGFRARARDVMIVDALAGRGRFLVGDEDALTRLLGR